MSTWTRDGLPDFSGVDWRAMYEEASRERDEAERERDSWRERAEQAEQALRDYISAEAMGPNPYPLNAAPAVTRSEVEETLQAATNAPAGWTLHSLTDAVCRLFGVADPDPVEVLAEQIESATREAVRHACDTLSLLTPGVDPQMVEKMLEITETSRKVAAHVLSQDSNDE